MQHCPEADWLRGLLTPVRIWPQRHVLCHLHYEIVAVTDSKGVGDREARPGIFLAQLAVLLADRRRADLLRVVAVRVLPRALA